MKNNKLKKLENLKLRTSTFGLKNKLGIIAIVCLLIFAGYSGVNATIKLGNDGTTDWSMVDTDKIRTSDGKSFPATGIGFQDAIWSLNGSGGKVWLPKGNISLTSTIQIVISDLDMLDIEGMGWSTTLSTTGAFNAINVTSNSPAGTSILTLSNFRLRGWDVGLIGLYIYEIGAGHVARTKVERLWVGFFTQYGIYDGSDWGTSYRDCWIRNNGATTAETGGMKIDVDGGGSLIDHCVIEWNHGTGIIFSGGYGNVVCGETIVEGNDFHGIWIKDTCQYGVIRDSLFEQNNQTDTNNMYDIFLNASGDGYWLIDSIKATHAGSHYCTKQIYSNGSYTSLNNIHGGAVVSLNGQYPSTKTKRLFLTAGEANYTEGSFGTFSSGHYVGIKATANANITATFNLRLPQDYASGLTIKAAWLSGGGNTKYMNWSLSAYYCIIGTQTWNTYTDTPAVGVTKASGSNYVDEQEPENPLTFSSLNPLDDYFISIKFHRDGTVASDTLDATTMLLGLVVEYQTKYYHNV